MLFLFAIKISMLRNKITKNFKNHVLYPNFWTNYIMEVLFMGIKNMFKKSSKLFDKEGFYVILFVCLCIVAVAAVYISRNNANTAKNVAENKKPVVEQKQEPNNAQQVLKEENKENSNNTVPTMQQPKISTNTSSISTTKASKASDNDKYAKSSTTKVLSMIAPVEGDITKKFDKENLQESKTMQQWETHEGIDIACDLGTEVKAAAAGKVVDVYKDDEILENLKSGFGVTVLIEHENGYRTMYSNLAQEIKVKKGDQVKKGQVIGTVGDTSVREAVSIEGSHLHFVVFKKSGKGYVTVNPEEYILKKQ
jgi:murein DD-endopeptidase MepM/ murein hydrolase activator NlpD